jgi:hypothetical protein
VTNSAHAAPDRAYTAGIVAILLVATVVFFLLPRPVDEKRSLARYHAEDTGGGVRPSDGTAAALTQPAQ